MSFVFPAQNLNDLFTSAFSKLSSVQFSQTHLFFPGFLTSSHMKMKVPRRSDTLFTIDQENWIIGQFHQGISPIQIKLKFQMLKNYEDEE